MKKETQLPYCCGPVCACYMLRARRLLTLHTLLANDWQVDAADMLDDSTVNGGTYENYFYGDVSPGETANEICAYDGLTSIDELKDIHAQLSVYEIGRAHV